MPMSDAPAELRALNPDQAMAAATAGLRAREVREATRKHTSNLETVRNGTNGPGVLEVTERPQREARLRLEAALDELDQFLAPPATEGDVQTSAPVDTPPEEAAPPRGPEF